MRASMPTRRGFSALALALPLAACASPLKIFNALTPKEAGSRGVGRDLAYGPGPRQKLDVFAPRAAAEAAPVLVFFYGGGWHVGEKSEYEFAGRAFAAQGFITVVPNYRLAPEAKFPDFLEDCASAVKWVQANIASYGGDPRRIVMCGHSAGAYNAVMLALDTRYARQGGFDLASIKGVAGLSGPYDFLPLDSKLSIGAFGGTPDLEQTQPVRFARAGAPPLLLIWGAKDRRVARRNIDSLAQAMRKAGGEVETIIYPKVNHGGTVVSLSIALRGSAPVLQDVTAFARRVTSTS
jgi:acetyl esterase/lipase